MLFRAPHGSHVSRHRAQVIRAALTYLYLLEYSLQVVPVQEVRLLSAVTLELHQEVAEQHHGHGLVIHRRFPEQKQKRVYVPIYALHYNSINEIQFQNVNPNLL